MRPKEYARKLNYALSIIKEVSSKHNADTQNSTNKLCRSSQQKDKDTTLLNFSLFHEFGYLTEASLHEVESMKSMNF